MKALVLHASLDAHWATLVYERGRLARHPLSAPLAVRLDPLIARNVALVGEQRARWAAEIEAQAGVEQTGLELDGVTARIVEELRHLERFQRSPRRLSGYLGGRDLKGLVHLGVERHVATLATWPVRLDAEPEPSLRALGAELRATLAAARSALFVRTEARAERAVFREHTLRGYVDQCNRVRHEVFTRLMDVERERGLPPGWAAKVWRGEAPRARPAAGDARPEREPTPRA